MIDIERFKTRLPIYLGKQFKSSQLEGFEIITKKFFELKQTNIDWLAYALATAFHETAHTMKPVTEYGSQKYLRSKKYWPFIGRGYVQLTWDFNYKKYGIEKDPEKAKEPDFAAFILIDGMVNGVFTGKKLSNYFTDVTCDPVRARKIINGMDKANLIAGHYHAILNALNESKTIQQKVS